VHNPEGRDLLYPAAGNTFRGRMPAWCETRQVSYRVSLSELPDDLPLATRLWVRGFLAGQVPTWDDAAPEEEQRRHADEFLTSGTWPRALST
jgi:hypothetical protein